MHWACLLLPHLATLTEAERILGDTVIRAEFAGRLDGVAPVVAGGQVNANEVLASCALALRVSKRFSRSRAGAW